MVLAALWQLQLTNRNQGFVQQANRKQELSQRKGAKFLSAAYKFWSIYQAGMSKIFSRCLIYLIKNIKYCMLYNHNSVFCRAVNRWSMGNTVLPAELVLQKATVGQRTIASDGLFSTYCMAKKILRKWSIYLIFFMTSCQRNRCKSLLHLRLNTYIWWLSEQENTFDKLFDYVESFCVLYEYAERLRIFRNN